MDDSIKQGISAALGRMPTGVFILTAQHEERRQGIVCSWAQQVCFEPPMVCVAVAKGRPIMPLISESRQFGLCQLPADDRLILRKFSNHDDAPEDPFLGTDLREPQVLVNLPLLNKAIGVLECELACHMDVEGDHDLFVGRVHGGHGDTSREPMVRIREDGFKY